MGAAGSDPYPSTLSAQLGNEIPVYAAAQESHFIKRARQRFGLKLTHERYRYLVRKVVEVLPGTRFVSPGDTPNRTRWRIRAGGHLMIVVYDETTDRLVTCVPDEIAAPRRERHGKPDPLRRWLAHDHKFMRRRLATTNNQHAHQRGDRALNSQLSAFS